MSLTEKLEKIKQPKLQSQHHTAVVLSAVEHTLRDQKSEFTPTAYFAALLALLGQSNAGAAATNKDLIASVLYLLDLTAPHVPSALLRSRFSQILASIAPVLTSLESEAPVLRSCIGCLGSLLLAQDTASWALPQSQVSPRRGLAGLVLLATDHRPKVRRKAQDTLAQVLKTPPPSPSLDHPAADMCAETALRGLMEKARGVGRNKKDRQQQDSQHEPGLIHALHLVKTISTASGGWPSKNIESLCEVLMNISRASNEYLTMGVFEVFETIFEGMADDASSPKLPKLMDAILELKPAQNDSQLLPPWVAVISRGYDVSAQADPQETFEKLPELFELVSGFMSSQSHNIRISASECLISFMANCIPEEVILEPSVYDEKNLEKLGKCILDLLSVKYQSAWMETFKVIAAMLETLKWRAFPLMSNAVITIGELRGGSAFQGKKEADAVLGSAISAMGPEAFLSILPLDMSKQKSGQQGRPWLLPLLRDHVSNTNLAHFRSEFVPLSERMYQRVLNHAGGEKTMEIKIFETLVQQIWALLPGYCDLPLDITTSFDQTFAELLSNLLYKQTDLRVDICRALQNLVDSNQAILDVTLEPENMLIQRKVSKVDAQRNIEHLAGFAGNLLAVLFNVYSETLPQYRGYILKCINSYLKIIPETELMETFTRVSSLLETSIPSEGPQNQADKQHRQKQPNSGIPPASHTLMDLVITMSIYLPRSSFGPLFNMAALTISTKSNDPQLQKKAYKLIPRLAESETGQKALAERNTELQSLFLSTADSTPTPARRDRLQALSQILTFLPPSQLHFVPSVLSEVVLACKESNQKARSTAFEVLIQLAHTTANAPEGTLIRTDLIPHMPADAASTPATLSEFFTMVSAGLAGSTPHMVSASITALARLTYEFHSQLPNEAIVDILQTIDIFIASNNREIVRSVLGFVKVAIISLPKNLIHSRLETLIPGLMIWSHENSGRLRSKVKNILERMIRRFGASEIEQWTPEADRKLVVHIRKERERKKKKKTSDSNAADEDGDDAEEESGRGRKKFDSEFDEAVYSSSDDSGDDSDDVIETKSAGARKRQHKQYIQERESSPLDLLATDALASISSTKPVQFKNRKPKSAAKTDTDGKLILGGPDDDEDMALDPVVPEGKGGVDSYMDAVAGPDAVKKGLRGRLKVGSGMKRADRRAAEMDVDGDDEDVVAGLEKLKGKSKGRIERGGKGSRPQRRSLGGAKVEVKVKGGSGSGRRGERGGMRRGSGGAGRAGRGSFRGSGIRKR